jgi:hypothetical protein
LPARDPMRDRVGEIEEQVAERRKARGLVEVLDRAARTPTRPERRRSRSAQRRRCRACSPPGCEGVLLIEPFVRAPRRCLLPSVPKLRALVDCRRAVEVAGARQRVDQVFALLPGLALNSPAWRRPIVVVALLVEAVVEPAENLAISTCPALMRFWRATSSARCC